MNDDIKYYTNIFSKKFITESNNPKIYEWVLDTIREEPYKSRIRKILENRNASYILLVGPGIDENIENLVKKKDDIKIYFDMIMETFNKFEEAVTYSFKYYSNKKIVIVDLNKY